MKTATLERTHIYGTPRHQQALVYRGNVVRFWEHGHSTYLQAPCFGLETIASMVDRALEQGFTHIRFAGDWQGYTVRKTMKLVTNRYTLTG